MSYLNGLIGSIFVLIALLYVPHPTPFAWAPYAGAAVLAFLTLKHELARPLARALAIVTTVTMFFFFACFFVVVPKLAADWYQRQEGWTAVCLLLSAFAMLPILADYSCRLKADCEEARARGRSGFFSVPNHLRPHR